MNPPVPHGKAAGMSLNAFLRRLIWLCVVPLLLLASWLALDSVRSSRTARDAEAANLAKNFATAIDQYLDARIGALGMLAASPLASDATRRAELYQEAQGFYQHFGSHVILADVSLQMLFNTRVPLGTALPRLPRPQGRAAAPQVLETGAPAVGDVFLGPIADTTLVAIAVPGKRDGKVAFLLLTTLEARQFQERLAKLALPSGWSLTLRDGTGATIARSAPPGLDSSRDVDSTGRFIVPSARSPWSVLLEIPRQIYRAPLLTAAAMLVLLILGATLVGVVGGTLASSRLGKALEGLTAPAAPEAAPPAIAEIAAVRGVLQATAQERASAEAALQRSERRFRLAASTGNVWDWNISPRKVSFPMEFWLGLGYAQTEVEEPVAMFESLLHPADLPRWHQALQDHIQHRVPYELDYRIREKSGAYRWFTTRGQAQWEDGRASYMAGTTFDISARKLAEQKVQDQIEQLTRSEAETRQLLVASSQSRRALLGVLEDQAQAEAARQVSEQKLQLMLNAADIGHWDIDLMTNVSRHSLQHDQIFGYAEMQSDWTYDKFLAHVHPDDRAQAARLFRAGATAKTAWDFECRIIRCDGALRWIWVHGNVFANAAGRSERAAGMVRDITERKQAEAELLRLHEELQRHAVELEQRVAERTEQLEAANQGLEAFSYSVSHDLKAPLRGIDGYSLLLEQDYGARLEGDALIFLRNIRQGAAQMHELIDDLLTYSRMERRPIEPAELDLAACVNAVTAEYAQEMAERGVVLGVEVPSITVRADRDGLAIVLRNLIDNAIKFSKDAQPPTITISAEARAHQVSLRVRDNGIGFDMKFHDRIFEMFNRLQRAEDFPGTGVGLALVHKAMQRMGGSVRGESAPGAGATFVLEIPT